MQNDNNKNNKSHLLTNIIKVFKNTKNTLTTFLFKIKSNILIKKVKRKVLRTTFSVTNRIIEQINNISLRKILGEENQEAERAIKQFLHRIRKKIDAIKMAIKIFFEVPPIIREDLHKFTKYIKENVPRIISMFTNVYHEIAKFILFKFFALKRLANKNYSLKYILSNLYQTIKKTSVFILNILFFIIYELCYSIYKLVNKHLIITITLICLSAVFVICMFLI